MSTQRLQLLDLAVTVTFSIEKAIWLKALFQYHPKSFSRRRFSYHHRHHSAVEVAEPTGLRTPGLEPVCEVVPIPALTSVIPEVMSRFLS